MPKSEEDYYEEELDELEDDEDEEEEEEEKTKKGDEGDKKNSLEAIAREMGWRPKEEFDEDDGREFVDAKTFILRGREIQDGMKDALKKQGKDIAGLKKTLEDVATHYKTAYKEENERLKTRIDELKKQRKEAIEEGDVETVDKLDTEIDSTKDKVREAENKASLPEEEEGEPKELTAEQQKAFTGWFRENPWYGQEDEMTEYAKTQFESDPSLEGLSFERRLKTVTNRVKTAFPEYFEKQDSSAMGNPPASNLESGRRQGPTKKKYTRKDVPREHRPIMDEFVKQGVMTQEEYIEDLVKMGEVA